MSPRAARSARVLNLIAGMSFFSQQMLLPLIGPYAAGLQMSALMIGVVVAIFALLPTAGAMAVGRWTDRLGPRTIFVLGAVGVLVSSGLYVVSHGFLVLALAQVVAGAARMLTWVCAQTAITRVADGAGEQGDHVVSRFTVYTAVGQAAGPLVGGLLNDHLGYAAAFLGFGCTGLVFLVLAGFTPSLRDMRLRQAERAARVQAAAAQDDSSSTHAKGDDKGTFGNAIRNRGVQLALAFSFVTLFAVGMRSSFYPVYLVNVGYSTTAIGLLLSVASLCSMAARPFTPYLLKNLGRSTFVMAAMAMAIWSMALTPLFRSAAPLLLMIVCCGVGAAFHQPVGLVLIKGHTTGALRGVAVGLRAAGNNVAIAVSPLVLGFVGDLFGLSWAFPVAGAAITLVALVVVHIDRQERAAAEARRRGALAAGGSPGA